MAVTKLDISKKVSDALSISINDSSKILDYFILQIKTKGIKSKIKITGFGSFFIHKTPKRIGRNPKTRESYIINPSSKLIFKASNKIKEVLNW